MNNLEYIRRMNGLSQMDLAMQLRCHPSILSRLEKGWQTNVSKPLQQRFVEAFGADWNLQKLLDPHEAGKEIPCLKRSTTTSGHESDQ